MKANSTGVVEVKMKNIIKFFKALAKQRADDEALRLALAEAWVTQQEFNKAHPKV
jgi:hypothetical protein